MAALGPAPFCGMMLADHGAEVITIERPMRKRNGDFRKDILNRSRRTLVLDLKHPWGGEIVRRLAASADGLIEGFRPGVMERLGLGPEVLMGENPRLVYGRMTGWGQSGPLAHKAGHDINYIALAGVLDACGRAGGQPTPPVNMLGDFGGGGMLLAFGMLAGILSARATGKGQVVDCAMTDGAALLSAMIWTMRAQGRWDGGRGQNLLDTGAHFYDTYETKDGRFVAVGAIEPDFYRQFCETLGVANDPEFRSQMDQKLWPTLKQRVAAIFKTRTREQWIEAFAGKDACFSPVLSLDEARAHGHNRERGLIIEVNGVAQPAPAPRFAGAGAATPAMPEGYGQSGVRLLDELGYSSREINEFIAAGVLGHAGEDALAV
jgi:alpha-methylacyl-CoA racemase